MVAFPATRLIGMRQQVALADNRLPALWQQFGPRVKEIVGADTSVFYNLKHFPPAMDWQAFNPQTPFEHWAAVAVSAEAEAPPGMAAMVIAPGLYAMFLHVGPASAFEQTLQAIFGQWLPASDYLLDSRPHFEILDADYRPDDPQGSEEVWIPVRPRTP